MNKFKIEIRCRENSDNFELWQHFLNEPKDILFPIKYSNLIWTDNSLKFITQMAIEKFNLRYNQINFTIYELAR